MYDSHVLELAERVLRTIRRKELIAPGDRVAVAVSGGADSLALLLILLELRSELGIILSVTHVNHKLRGEESDEDEQFVRDLAQRHKLDFHVRELPLPNSPDSGIEAAARELRYEFFRRLMADRLVSKVATAHTIDDQAETVLLRILRGTGLRGLAGIHPRLLMKHDGKVIGEVVRPLLSFHRYELESYLRGQQWREDSSNQDPGFSRNRIRHRVLPLLKHEFGEGSVDNLADLAEIARAEDEHWISAHPEILAPEDDIKVDGLLKLPLAAQRRLVRSWLEHSSPRLTTSYSLIEEVLDLAKSLAGKKLELPGGGRIRRAQHELRFENTLAAAHYQYRLTVPGHVDIAELNLRIEATLRPPDHSSDDPAQWLDPAQLPKHLVVRNWRPGDRFWPSHRKEPRKVKELLSERHLAGREKQLWPVIEAEGIGIVWMRGFSVPDSLRAASGSSEILCCREQAINGFT